MSNKQKIILILMVIFFLLAVQNRVEAQVQIANPQLVSYMKTEVVQTGTILLNNQNIELLALNIYVPQEDEYQKIESIEVSNQNYQFIYDEYGNRLLKMTWSRPQPTVDFKIKSIISTTRDFGKRYAQNDFLKPSNLIDSQDAEITRLSENFFGSDFEKILSAAEWVGENIIYDKNYSSVNLSAKQTLQIRRGTCDEFSNLLIAVTRSLGYYSAYIAGYAYSEAAAADAEKWQSHGWTSIDGMTIDPTWLEMPTDATHIKFAVLKDSQYTEANISIIGRGVTNKPIMTTDTKINILEFKQEPLIKTATTLLEEKLWKGYAVVKTDLSSDKCILSKISIRGCSEEKSGNDFLALITPKDDITYFCGKKTIFSIFKIPEDLNRYTEYNCPITVMPYLGEKKSISVKLQSSTSGATKLFLDKNFATSGESITAVAKNSHIFTSDGRYAFGEAQFAAENNFTVYSYSSGALAQQDVIVTKTKPLELFLTANETFILGKPSFVNITIKNLLPQALTATVRLTNQTETVGLSPQEEKTVSMHFTPQNKEDNFIQVFVLADGYSAYAAKIINVVEQEKSITSKITDWFSNLIKAIVNFFQGIFKQNSQPFL